MGQAESQPTEASVQTGVAFHVLRVAEKSPAAEAGIDPFFDFVCGVNGRPLGEEIDTLSNVLEEFEGRQIYLQIYSTKRKELRDVSLIPSRRWSSDPSSSASDGGQPSLLGLSLRLCNPQHALEQVWHVLEILEGSPAQSAGLVPFGDWIVGYAGGILRGEGDFYDVVEAHVDKPLRLFVYNADYDVTREAILVPNRSWGGEGLLGCGVGYGLLHRIPKPQDRANMPPEEDDDDDEVEPPTQLRSREQPHQHQQQQQQHHTHYDLQHDRQLSEEGGYTVSRRGHYEGGDGYEEAGYQHDGEYLVSEGVQVVPQEEEEEEQDLSNFAPATSFSSANVFVPSNPSRSSGSSSFGSGFGGAPSTRGQQGGVYGQHGAAQVIAEEEE